MSFKGTDKNKKNREKAQKRNFFFNKYFNLIKKHIRAQPKNTGGIQEKHPTKEKKNTSRNFKKLEKQEVL
jgi:hypothetical protein